MLEGDILIIKDKDTFEAILAPTHNGGKHYKCKTIVIALM